MATCTHVYKFGIVLNLKVITYVAENHYYMQREGWSW